MPKALEEDDTPASVSSINTIDSPVREIEFSQQTKVTTDLSTEHWFKTFWRPAMGWLYMAICAFDFIIFPIGTMLIPVYDHALKYTAWDPITLRSGGLIHLAFGAVLGVTAWGRSKEKISGAVSEA